MKANFMFVSLHTMSIQGKARSTVNNCIAVKNKYMFTGNKGKA